MGDGAVPTLRRVETFSVLLRDGQPWEAAVAKGYDLCIQYADAGTGDCSLSVRAGRGADWHLLSCFGRGAPRFKCFQGSAWRRLLPRGRRGPRRLGEAQSGRINCWGKRRVALRAAGCDLYVLCAWIAARPECARRELAGDGESSSEDAMLAVKTNCWRESPNWYMWAAGGHDAADGARAPPLAAPAGRKRQAAGSPAPPPKRPRGGGPDPPPQPQHRAPTPPGEHRAELVQLPPPDWQPSSASSSGGSPGPGPRLSRKRKRGGAAPAALAAAAVHAVAAAAAAAANAAGGAIAARRPRKSPGLRPAQPAAPFRRAGKSAMKKRAPLGEPAPAPKHVQFDDAPPDVRIITPPLRAAHIMFPDGLFDLGLPLDPLPPKEENELGSDSSEECKRLETQQQKKKPHRPHKNPGVTPVHLRPKVIV